MNFEMNLSSSSSPIGFLPNWQESVMDELRTTEGMIFRDESAKKLFLDIKYFIMEELVSKFKNLSLQDYMHTLDEYIAWNESTAKEEVNKANLNFRDISERLVSVTALYAKYLYGRSAAEAPRGITIRKPRLSTMLKGMFTRMARVLIVRNGDFFKLDPIRQDFVFRDTFRQALGNDCIELIEEKTDLPVNVMESFNDEEGNNLEEKEEEDTEKCCENIDDNNSNKNMDSNNEVVQEEKEDERENTLNNNDEDEVYPDDSISQVMQQMQHSSKHEIPQNNLNNEEKFAANEKGGEKSELSTFTSVSTKSGYRKPKKIQLSEV